MTLTSTLPVWDDRRWPGLPSLHDDVETDVCVIGLGGSGLSCIAELQRLGARVVGVDASDVGAGAAGRNGGFLLAGIAAFHHDAAATLGRERAVHLYRLTLRELERIAAETPEAVRRVGSLRVATSVEEEADCARQLATMQADGLPAEPYEGPEGRGLLVPTDGAFNPLLRCRLLAHRALEAGAQLYGCSPAVSVSGTEVRTPQGRVRCERVVVAVDGRLEVLLPELAGRVRTARLQMLATAPTTEVRVPRPVYARYGYEYWQQLPDGRVALGGFRDLGGDEEWTVSTAPSARVQGALERFLREHVGVQAPVTHRWAASVGYTPDGAPLLEEVRDGVWAVGGYCGTGNVVGAMYGRAAAQLVVRGESEVGVG
ncbi:MAG TPA: FAD-dependent oxidoreductase [Gemmatimonadaceae bacterium]|nr:FAD-dependent oxidoreductase [Gemmatimonadaceae bacterium]